jgi:hypothetical protein
MNRIWAGIDCGKTHHHCVVLDADGKTLLSRRVANDEPQFLQLLGDVLDTANGREVTWALDMTGGEPGLLIAVLINHLQELLCIPGRMVNRASDDTAVRARLTPAMPGSSLTRHACAATCGPSAPETKPPSSLVC